MPLHDAEDEVMYSGEKLHRITLFDGNASSVKLEIDLITYANVEYGENGDNDMIQRKYQKKNTTRNP